MVGHHSLWNKKSSKPFFKKPKFFFMTPWIIKQQKKTFYLYLLPYPRTGRNDEANLVKMHKLRKQPLKVTFVCKYYFERTFFCQNIFPQYSFLLLTFSHIKSWKQNVNGPNKIFCFNHEEVSLWREKCEKLEKGFW